MKNTTRLFVVAMILMAVIAMCVGCNVTGNTKETEAPTAEQTDVKATDAPTEQPTEEVTEHIHAFGEWSVSVPATCTEDGMEIRTCACGEQESRPVAATGHKEVKNGEDIAATCQSVGKTTGTVCEYCGLVMSEDTEVEKLAHQYDDDGMYCLTCGTMPCLCYESNGDGTCVIQNPTWDGEDVSNIYTSYEDYGLDVTNLLIPTVSPNGEKVVKVGVGAFYGCKNIKNIYVPEGIEVIRDSGFANCPALESIYLPASLIQNGWHTTDNSQMNVYCAFGEDKQYFEDFVSKNVIPGAIVKTNVAADEYLTMIGAK